MLDVPYLFLNQIKHILLLLSNATSNCRQEERDRRGSLTSWGPPTPPPQSGVRGMPALKSVQESLIFVICLLQILLFFLFTGLSFNQPYAGREKRAHWVISSYSQHFLTWKMIQWEVELEGFWVFSMFKYSPELSSYRLQFVKLGFISILCLIIRRTSSKYRLPEGSGWWCSVVS